MFCVRWEGCIIMLIKRIELENIKSYRHLAVDFRRGTTAISGANGAGKTTLVEAIGFALFDYLPYNQGQFVREGEKYGRVVVHLIGSDDRMYEVERRCGSGAQWIVYDCEANFRLEQRADVMDKLHELFGIDRERSLSALFKDALGVPQGTFTAIFLQTSAVRKQTFDTLLQIEDYKTAADYLLDAQKQYREQAQTQQMEIQRLTFETQSLEEWRNSLREARLLDQQKKEQNVRCNQQLNQYKERFEVLKRLHERLRQTEHQYERNKAAYEADLRFLQSRGQELQLARIAQEMVVASTADYQRYQGAMEALKQLRKDERQRNLLRQRQSTLGSRLATTQANSANWQSRLAEVAAAQKQMMDLLPLYEQQVELERQRDDLTQKSSHFDALAAEYKRLKQLQAKYLQQQEALQRRIAEIEPLQPLADLLSQRNEELMNIRVQLSERSSKSQQLHEKRELLREKQVEREQTAANLRKAENNVAIIEEHRQEAEEMPSLQEQREQLLAQQHRLQGNIDGYKKSRAQSAGGQCPLLYEACLNIKQRGMVSLESYFDNLLTEEHAQMAVVLRQQEAITERMSQIKKYADALNKLGQYIEKRDGQAEHLQRVALEISRLERDVNALAQDLETLKRIDQQLAQAEAAYSESKKADAQVRELAGLQKQVEQLQEQIEQCAADMRERRQQAEELRGSREQLGEVKQALIALNDPRSLLQAQKEIIKQEANFQRQLQEEEQKQKEIEQELASVDQQLVLYARLDEHIGEQEAIRHQSEEGYQNYLKNEEAARRLPEREQAYQQAQRKAEQAQQALVTAEQAYQEAKAAFNQNELDEVNAAINRLHGELEGLAEAMRALQAEINKLEQDIQQAQARLVELEAAQKEKQTLEELHTMMEMFRKLIKEAAPHVLKALLNDISAEANRIFGEIMGDRSAQLSWQNDYEVVLRRQGVNRTFAQLSGGEQMSAALSVRLALLKKLSGLNIAFFDEPTQNMDELRRMNLAEQIRRVRGFDQLIVISHDDTFEQGLDSLVRLRKENGETLLMGEEELRTIVNPAPGRTQGQGQALPLPYTAFTG